MVKDIPKVYYKINKFLKENYKDYNTVETRELVKEMLWKELPYYTDSIVCDETNNTQKDIKDNILNVKYRFYKQYGGDMYYIDLKFGDIKIEFSV